MADTPKFLPYLIGTGGLLLGALFVFLGSRLWKSSRELATAGVSVEATVSKKFRREAGATWGGLENAFVLLAYTDASGQAHEAELKVATKIWRQLDEGGTFGVSYLPAQPERVFPHTVLAHKIRCGVAVALFGFGAVAVILFPIGALREIWRSRAQNSPAREHTTPGA
jgi:hypothetical protein